MPTVAQQVRALTQLFRVKPVLSWGVSSLLLGGAVATARVGLGELNLVNGGLAVVLVLVAQGVVSHGINDAYDWLTGTDKASIGKGTGGSRVIPQGKMTVEGTLVASLAGIFVIVLISAHFLSEYGAPMIVLGAIAIWSPVAYSTPPLKLGYRPFNELVVVLPALVGVVIGADMVLAGSISPFAAAVGTVHALFCISWFVVSRVPDYEPDRRVGKITSVVYVGRDNAALLSSGYLALGLAAAVVVAAFNPFVLPITVASWAVMMVGLSQLDAYDPENASEVRLRNMHTTTAHAVGLAIIIAVVGGV
jgi:1,4-dihydroxy-2-naphthoate octaprenyltransferase